MKFKFKVCPAAQVCKMENRQQSSGPGHGPLLKHNMNNHAKVRLNEREKERERKRVISNAGGKSITIFCSITMLMPFKVLSFLRIYTYILYVFLSHAISKCLSSRFLQS